MAAESPSAARRIAERIRAAGVALGDFAIGRPGVVKDTYERVPTDIPYTLVYTIDDFDGCEVISILRVVHEAQLWPPEKSWQICAPAGAKCEEALCVGRVVHLYSGSCPVRVGSLSLGPYRS